MLLRPEQKHGFSGEHNIFVPVAGGHGDMDDPVAFYQTAIVHMKRHLEITTTTRGRDSGILCQHDRNAKRIPDAVSIVVQEPHLHGKGGWNGGKWCGSPQLAMFLKYEGVRSTKGV